jgi:Holliday junction resolvasome RuvABC DNA-binding subunit
MARMQRIVEELRSLEPHGVSDKVAQSLIDAGVAGLAHILEMTDEDLQQVEGVGPKTAEKIREAATAAKAEWDKKDAEEAARVEAERVESERLAAEQAAEQAEEERRLAEEQALAEQAEAEPAEGAPAAPEGVSEETPEPATQSVADGSQGGKADGER